MKKSLIITFVLSLPLFLKGETFVPELTAKSYIMINLGENCSARAALESVNIKQESYPFDSFIVPFQGLFDSIEDDFRDYTNPDHFTMYFNKQGPVNKYGVVIAHNFPIVVVGQKENGEDILEMDPNWRAYLPEVEAKFVRRTNRFRAACRSGKKVCFFRYLGIEKKEAKRFTQLIEKMYPELDYMMLCVQNSTTSKRANDWGLPRVKNDYLNVNAPSAQEEWARIFRAAGLIN